MHWRKSLIGSLERPEVLHRKARRSFPTFSVQVPWSSRAPYLSCRKAMCANYTRRRTSKSAPRMPMGSSIRCKILRVVSTYLADLLRRLKAPWSSRLRLWRDLFTRYWVGGSRTLARNPPEPESPLAGLVGLAKGPAARFTGSGWLSCPVIGTGCPETAVAWCGAWLSNAAGRQQTVLTDSAKHSGFPGEISGSWKLSWR